MNILFVDDQPNVLSSLLIGINWRSMGFSSVYSATSAEDAKSIISSHSVDILVTDVEMPGEDGLSLLSWVRENHYDIGCIILTAHMNFFYAQQAMSLQASEYVLQPAKKEDIIQAVEKLRSRMEAQRNSSGQPSSLTSAAQSAMINEFFRTWPSHQEFMKNPELLQSRIRKMNEFEIIANENSNVLLLCISFDTWTSIPMTGPKLLSSYEIIVKAHIKTAVHELSYRYSASCIFSFLVLSDKQPDLSETSLSAFRQEIEDRLHCRIRILYGIVELSRVKDAMEELLRQKDSSYASVQPLQRLDFHVLLSDDELPDYRSYHDKALAYIRSHIGEPITRAEIADALYISESHLSHILRETAGCGCKELITQEKMRHAQHLLRNTRLPIGNVAQACGYDSFAYFSKVYRDYYGIKPSDERKKQE